MTTFTQPITNAMEKLSALNNYPTVQQEFETACAALLNAATKDGHSTPFTDGGEIRDELAESEEFARYLFAKSYLEDAERNRDTMLTGAAIATVSIAGAVAGGLALREAHRRGWVSGALRTINKGLAPKIIARRYGKLAGTVTRLALDGKVTIVTKDARRWEGTVHLAGDGFTQQTREGAKISIPFDAVIKIEQTLDGEGHVKWASIEVADMSITRPQ